MLKSKRNLDVTIVKYILSLLGQIVSLLGQTNCLGLRTLCPKRLPDCVRDDRGFNLDLIISSFPPKALWVAYPAKSLRSPGSDYNKLWCIGSSYMGRARRNQRDAIRKQRAKRRRRGSGLDNSDDSDIDTNNIDDVSIDRLDAVWQRVLLLRPSSR